MIRCAIALGTLLSLASTASALIPADPYKPVFDRQVANTLVGETIVVEVGTTGSGYAGSQSEQWFLPWNFASNDESIALVEGRLEDPRSTVKIFIIDAMGPRRRAVR